jgi:hypothetical protein
MATRNEMTTVAPQPDRYRFALTYYEIALAVAMMGLGLWRWAVIVGLLAGTFDAMSAPVKVATMFLAVADLVAAVGLWMRVDWGRVIFVATAIAEIALHTAFVATYGTNWSLVGFHLAMLTVYSGLAVAARRRPANSP